MNEPTEILLVEDSPCDAELILRTLRQNRLGSRVVHLEDGQAALDWLHGTDGRPGHHPAFYPKVVLLDLKLPRVGGLEVLRAVRADPRTALLPVVIMTSSGEEQDVLASYQHGANSYVVKPMDFDGFTAALAELGHYWVRVNRDPAKGRR